MQSVQRNLCCVVGKSDTRAMQAYIGEKVCPESADVQPDVGVRVDLPLCDTGDDPLAGRARDKHVEPGDNDRNPCE